MLPKTSGPNSARLITLTVLLTLLTWLPISARPTWAASGAPGINAKITKSNVQKLLGKYDPDGAYIIKKQLTAGGDIMNWFSDGKRIIDRIDTAVHEETHGYSYSYAKASALAYFVGKKKTIYVSHTKVYPSKKMAASIPKSLRTFRYDTYIGNPSPNLSSNINGAYGLLNEFMAYRAGMNTTLSLYSYLTDKKADWSAWQRFVTGCENNRLAFGEFKYYILHYLYYAKKHNPQVYNGIIKNKEFCKAYRLMEHSYRKLITAYEKDLKKMKAALEKKGYKVRISDGEIMVYSGRKGTGVRRFSADYKKLYKEVKKSRYGSIHKKLVRNGK